MLKCKQFGSDRRTFIAWGTFNELLKLQSTIKETLYLKLVQIKLHCWRSILLWLRLSLSQWCSLYFNIKKCNKLNDKLCNCTFYQINKLKQNKLQKTKRHFHLFPLDLSLEDLQTDLILAKSCSFQFQSLSLSSILNSSPISTDRYVLSKKIFGRKRLRTNSCILSIIYFFAALG